MMNSSNRFGWYNLQEELPEISPAESKRQHLEAVRTVQREIPEDYASLSIKQMRKIRKDAWKGAATKISNTFQEYRYVKGFTLDDWISYETAVERSSAIDKAMKKRVVAYSAECFHPDTLDSFDEHVFRLKEKPTEVLVRYKRYNEYNAGFCTRFLGGTRASFNIHAAEYVLNEREMNNQQPMEMTHIKNN